MRCQQLQDNSKLLRSPLTPDRLHCEPDSSLHWVDIGRELQRLTPTQPGTSVLDVDNHGDGHDRNREEDKRQIIPRTQDAATPTSVERNTNPGRARLGLPEHQ